MSSSGYSSDEEESEIPKTSGVYLGYIDADFKEADDVPTIEDSFVGGQPIWLHPKSKPASDLLLCKNCTGPLSLILQAFSPLESTLYDRVIYVFGCKKPQCARRQGSVRVIRGVSKDPKKISELEKQEQEELKNQLDEKLKLDSARNINLFDTETKSNPFASSNPFGGLSNPFGANTNPFSNDKPAQAEPKNETTPSKPNFAEIAAKATPPKSTPKSKKDIKLSEYPGYFLYVDQEKFNKKNKPKVPEHIKIDESALDLEAETSGSSGAKDSNPEFQQLSNSLQDAVFQQFSDIVAYNPLQVLRYDLGGKPLLFSGKDDTAVKVSKKLVPSPGYNPASSRQFELQVMPKVIMDLERDETDIVNGLSWGTILVYTDVEDYMPELDDNHVGYIEEWAGVQWEEEVKR